MHTSLIEWRDEFALGIPDVDHEHRELIELMNELYAELVGPERAADVGHFFGELYAQVSAHFALEEKMMREHQYDEYQAHKDNHEQLLDRVRDLMDDYEDGVWVDMEAFSKVLSDWFTVHFRSFDARLHHRLAP